MHVVKSTTINPTHLANAFRGVLKSAHIKYSSKLSVRNKVDDHIVLSRITLSIRWHDVYFSFFLEGAGNVDFEVPRW